MRPWAACTRAAARPERSRLGRGQRVVLGEEPGRARLIQPRAELLHLVLPAHHPQAKRPRVRLEQLRDDAFIAYSTDRYLRDLQLAALARAGVTPRRLHAADSSETILGFVAAGLGFSLLASLLPGGPREAGVVSKALPGAGTGSVHAAWRKTAARSPLIQAALSLAPRR
nr:LysR substrate-binding domain-containing protein [Myxococcus sp. AM009]